MHLKDPKSTTNKDICIFMFIGTVHSSQEMGQPRCPSIDEWIKRMWSICTVEFYTAIKNDICRDIPGTLKSMLNKIL